MADAIWWIKIKSYILDLDKTWWGFSGSPIISLRSKLINPKSWIQHGEPKYKNLRDPYIHTEPGTWGVFITVLSEFLKYRKLFRFLVFMLQYRVVKYRNIFCQIFFQHFFLAIFFWRILFFANYFRCVKEGNSGRFH